MAVFTKIISLFFIICSTVLNAKGNTFNCGVDILPPFPFPTNLTKIPLPLVNLHADVKVTANIASSKLSFTYENPANESVNVHFKFPSDVDTAIYKVLIKYDNGDELEAVIEEKEKADKMCKDATDAGHKCVKVDTDDREEDVLKFKMTNLPANEKVTVTVYTSQELTYRRNFLKYKLLTSMFQRYNSKDPSDEAFNDLKETFPGVFRSDHKVTPEFDFTLTFAEHYSPVSDSKVRMDTEIFAFDADTRQITISNSTLAKKVFEKDGNVEILFNVIDLEAIKQSIVTHEEKTVYSHFIHGSEFDQYKRGDDEKPLEYILIVDNSGSMSGQRIVNAKLAVQQMVNILRAGSAFNIIKFGSTPERLFEQSKVLTKDTKKEALDYIENMGADMGGTELMSALQLANCPEGKTHSECLPNLGNPDGPSIKRKYTPKKSFIVDLSKDNSISFENYTINEDVHWEINLPDGHNQVEITIGEIDIENNNACNYDWLQIRATSPSGDETGDFFCGSNPPKPIIYTDKKIELEFHSDGSQNRKGFKVSFTSTSVVSTPQAVATTTPVPVSKFYKQKQVFAITDGDIGNQAEVFDYVKSNSEKSRVFAVGIGAGASTSLVKGMASNGGGYAIFVNEEEEKFFKQETLASSVIKAIIGSGNAYFTNFKLNDNPYPAYVPEVVTGGIFINIYTEEFPQQQTLTYEVKDIEGKHHEIKEVDFQTDDKSYFEAELHEGAMSAIFGKRVMQQKYKTYNNAEYDEKDDIKSDIVELSKATNVLCPFTSFINIEKNSDGELVVNSTDIFISAENSVVESPDHGGMVHYKSMSYSRPMAVGMRGPPMAVMSSMPRGRVLSSAPRVFAAPPPMMQTNAVTDEYSQATQNSVQSASQSVQSVTDTEESVEMDLQTTLPILTTTPAFTEPINYQSLTNIQNVNGTWDLDALQVFFDNTVFSEDDLQNSEYVTSIGLVLLEKNFSDTKFEWEQSATMALESMGCTASNGCETRIQEYVNDIITKLQLSVSVNDILF